MDIFSPDFATKLLEHIKINNHPINLVKDQPPFYKPIYSPEVVKQESLKTYIKINLGNSFIKPSKSLVGAPIYFV